MTDKTRYSLLENIDIFYYESFPPKMPMLADPSKKYRRFEPLHLPDRQWPSKTIGKPPRWLSTDLRDGNQSLADPMNGDQKWRYFQMLVKLGYKEIEVSFPSASQTDFDFTQKLVQTPGVVPDDVWLQVLSPCRKELIRKTVDSLKGAKKALLHLYLATSPCFQQIVFNMDNAESKALAVECTRYARSITKDDPSQAGTEWAYEFSPETFSDSNPDFVLEVCEAVKAAWEPSVENPIIFNLEPRSKWLHLISTLIRLNISAEIFQSETKYVSLYILTMIEVVRSLRQS